MPLDLIIDPERPSTINIRPTDERGLVIDAQAREALKASTGLDEDKFVGLVNAIYVIGTLWFVEERDKVDNQADTDRITKALRLFHRGARVLSELPEAKLESVSLKLGIDHHRLSLTTQAKLMKSLRESRVHFQRRSGGKAKVDEHTLRASERLVRAWEAFTCRPADQHQYNGSMRDVYWKLMSKIRIKQQQLSITPVKGYSRRWLVETPTWDCSKFRDACKEDLLNAVLRRDDRVRKTPSK